MEISGGVETRHLPSIEELDPECRAAASGWEDVQTLHWVDSVAWIAARDPELMKIIRGWRHLIKRDITSGSEAHHSEPHCRGIARAYISKSEWDSAERLLRQKLHDGSLDPIIGVSRGPATAANWAEPTDGLDRFLGIDVPDVLLPRERVLEVWPQRAAESAPGIERSKSAGIKLKAKPGPTLDLEWKDKVYAYCKAIGRSAVASPAIGGRVFHKNVKDWYHLSREDSPLDYRRTQHWRERWLDEKSGLSG